MPLIFLYLQEEKPTSLDLDANVYHHTKKFEEEETHEDVRENDALNIEVDDTHIEVDNVGVDVQ